MTSIICSTEGAAHELVKNINNVFKIEPNCEIKMYCSHGLYEFLYKTETLSVMSAYNIITWFNSLIGFESYRMSGSPTADCS